MTRSYRLLFLVMVRTGYFRFWVADIADSFATSSGFCRRRRLSGFALSSQKTIWMIYLFMFFLDVEVVKICPEE